VKQETFSVGRRINQSSKKSITHFDTEIRKVGKTMYSTQCEEDGRGPSFPQAPGIGPCEEGNLKRRK